MTITDFLAVYGAILATLIAGWDLAKFALERPRLRVSCYIGQLVTPGVGVSPPNRIVYSVANTGGKAVVVTTLGGALRSGSYFMFIPDTVQLPITLQPGESMVVPGPMPENLDDVTRFIVHDGLGKQWKASTKVVREQLAARARKAS